MFRLLAIFVLLAGCPLTLLTGTQTPEIVSFTATQTVQMQHIPFTSLTWETRHATYVSLEIGAVEDGMFVPGSGYSDDLPTSGFLSIKMSIGNYAGRLCAYHPPAEPVCMVCNPFTPDACE